VQELRMPRQPYFIAGSGLLCSTGLVAQHSAVGKASEPRAIPMSHNCAADSFRIYSSLIPLGETGNPG
jgi:hypothetical protein